MNHKEQDNYYIGGPFMARSSSIKNKTVYQLRREELGLSREKASELLEMLAPSILFRDGRKG